MGYGRRERGPSSAKKRCILAGAVHHLEVGRLGGEAARELVESVTGTGKLPACVVDYVVQHSDGVPLNLECAPGCPSRKPSRQDGRAARKGRADHHDNRSFVKPVQWPHSTALISTAPHCADHAVQLVRAVCF